MNHGKWMRIPVLLFGILFLLTGLVYPLIIIGIAELVFPYQAHGSLVRDEGGVIIGSELIGQNFSGPLYFEGRPSSTTDFPYNAAQSGGSNLGPSNPALLEKVNAAIRHFEALGMGGPWPDDLITSSGSGLDPHITLESALLQVPAVARARGIGEEEVRELVYEHIEKDFFSLGNTYVNVFSLNRALDEVMHHA